MKEKSRQKYCYNWISGIITLLVFAVVYIIDGFFPFGSGSIAALDLNTQYLPLLYKFYDVIKGAGGVVVDYHIAGGMNLYSEMITELANPFNYFLLLFKREHLYLAVNLLPVLYGMAASVTASYAISQCCEKHSFIHVVLSVCYGLSFYNAYQFEIIRWMYLMVLFPVFVVSLKKILEEETVLWYILLLAYQLILSLQLGFQTCLFTLCAAVCYMLYLRDCGKREESLPVGAGLQSGIGRKCRLLGCSTAAALMISAINVLPALYNVLRSARFEENQSLIFVITQHGLDDILERLLEIGHPVVFGILAGIFVLRRKRVFQPEKAGQSMEESVRQQKYMRFFLLLLLATVILQPSNLLWHLGYYQCFPVRYGYMLLLMFILMAAKGNGNVEADSEPLVMERAEKKFAEKKYSTGLALTLAAGGLTLAVLVFAAVKRLMFSYAFATLAISRVCLKETFLFYGMMGAFAVSAMLSYLYAAKKGEQIAQKCGRAILLTAAAAAGAVCYLCVLFPQDFEARAGNESAYQVMSGLGNAPVSYSRIGHINDEESLLLNAPLVSGQYALTAYMPAGADQGFAKAMDRLGYNSPWVSVRSEGGTVVSDVLLGIHNPYVPDKRLQNGILISEKAYEQLTEGIEMRSPMLLQKGILRAMCSETSFAEDEIMDVWGADASQNAFKELSPCELQLTAKEPLLVYVWTDDAAANLYVNGKLLEREEAHQSQNPGRIRFLGKYEQEAVLFSAEDPVVLKNSTEIAVIRLDAFRAMCEELAVKNQRTIEPDDRHGTLHVHGEAAGSGVLLLPFAYLQGYRVEDVKEADAIQVSSFMNGLIQVRMTEPVTEFMLAYHYDILKWACCFSVVGIFLLVLAWLLQVFHYAGTVLCGTAKILFSFLAAVFLLGVYVLPNLGMAGYMTGKLFGKDLLEQYRDNVSESEADPILLQARPDEDGIHVVVAGENLVTSLGARLTADSVESKDFKAGKAGDGIVHDSFSRWSSENDWENANHYLQVDLKGRQTIRALRIFWYQSNAKEYEILVSDDRSFADSTVMASFSEAPATKEQVIYFENPVQARYVRVAVKDVNKREEDLSLYYQNISIEELEIYGDDSEQFVIEKPVLTGGSNREIPIPKVPEGYSLSVGGIDYGNLLADENHLTDTYAPVEVNLGYVLTCGRVKFDLPGFDLLLPASDESEPDDFPYQNIKVREWKAADGLCHVTRGMISELVDGALQQELGEEGYRIEIGQQEVALIAGTEQGLCWAKVTLEQMMQQTGELPCGIIRDYPAYPVRGFCIDVARRPIRMEMLYDIVDELSAQKMNTLQLHLNDNAIIAESAHDDTVEGARMLYSAFRLESDLTGENGGSLTAGDLYYTKEAFQDLVEYALQKGVEIVPEIDTPAHSMAFTKIMPSLGYKNDPELADTLDIANPETLSFVKNIWSEYLSDDGNAPAVFDKCRTLHLGMDEFYGKPVLYETYLTGLAEYVKEIAPEKRIRIWGSLSAVGVDLKKIPQYPELMIWNSYWTDPQTVYEAGFKVINCLNSDLYIIVGGGTDHLDVEGLSQSWQPNRFADGQSEVILPAWSDRMLGACYSMWNDHYTKGIDHTSEEDLMKRFREPLHVISERLW